MARAGAVLSFSSMATDRAAPSGSSGSALEPGSTSSRSAEARKPQPTRAVRSAAASAS
jgi:hypothetical protein